MELASLPEHGTWFFYLQRLCNHCTYPACLAACPRGAIYKRSEDGIVLIDQKRCRGYRKCVAQCPYKKPMFRPTTRVSEKCIACYPRIEGTDPLTGGQPMETRCMSACVGKIRLQGLVVDRRTGAMGRGSPEPALLSREGRQGGASALSAVRYRAERLLHPATLGAAPLIAADVRPWVDEAIEKYSFPSRELLAVLQLFRASQTIVFRYEIIEGEKVFERTANGKKWEIFNDTVIGYGQSGEEVARVTVEEPRYERPDKHYNSI